MGNLGELRELYLNNNQLTGHFFFHLRVVSPVRPIIFTYYLCVCPLDLMAFAFHFSAKSLISVASHFIHMLPYFVVLAKSQTALQE